MSENMIELRRILSELKTSESRTNQALGVEISRLLDAELARLQAERDALLKAATQAKHVLSAASIGRAGRYDFALAYKAITDAMERKP